MNDQDGILPLFTGVGIEIEYMIVDREQGNVLPVADEVLKSVAGEYVNDVDDGPIAWSNELVSHVIELKTNGPAASLDQLPDQFQQSIQRINRILENLNGQLMPTAMHPWMNPFLETRLWPHDSFEIYDTYNRIFDCRGHGWSNLQSTHINLPFANNEEFALLHAAIRIILPILPAIAASSPVTDCDYTGLMDTRLEAYRRNAESIPSVTGLVIPEPISSQHEYQRIILEPMYQDIAPHDSQKILQHEWLNSRGAIARFDRNTIEIRVLDTQETPAADIAIASLIIATLKKLVSGAWSDTCTQNKLITEELAELFINCVKDAESSVLRHRGYLSLFDFPDKNCEARELWQYLLEDYESTDGNEGTDNHGILAHIIREGSLARRIHNAIGKRLKRSRLDEAYRVMCDCLVNGTLFEGID